MMSGSSRKSYTSLTVIVTLENGTRHTYGWNTPAALLPALHKAPRWARSELRTKRVPGRSRIRSISVDAETIDGSFK